MAEVYKAYQPRLDRYVAIKLRKGRIRRGVASWPSSVHPAVANRLWCVPGWSRPYAGASHWSTVACRWRGASTDRSPSSRPQPTRWKPSLPV
jgi:hypothetical protein